MPIKLPRYPYADAEPLALPIRPNPVTRSTYHDPNYPFGCASLRETNKTLYTEKTFTLLRIGAAHAAGFFFAIDG